MDRDGGPGPEGEEPRANFEEEENLEAGIGLDHLGRLAGGGLHFAEVGGSRFRAS